MFRLQKAQCDQCLFSKNKIVSASRAKAIIADCQKRDTFFNCHKAQVNGDRNQICCRGYWDRYKDSFNLGRIAQRLKAVLEVEVK